MAESTPVSSVIRASTCTCPPLTDAFTSLMAGGLVSSARAVEASRAKAAKEARTRVRMARRLPHGPARSTLQRSAWHAESRRLKATAHHRGAEGAEKKPLVGSEASAAPR